MSDAPLFDRAALLDNLDQDVDLMQLMARTFVNDVPRLLTELRTALQAGDPAAATRASHNIKGSAANFGAVKLVALVQTMEQTCRHGDLSAAVALQKDAEHLVARLAVELRRELATP